MIETNRQWLLDRRPQGRVVRGDFRWVEGPVPSPADGEMLVRTLYLSVDAASRVWAAEQRSYAEPVRLGEVMRGYGVGVVMASRAQGFEPGELVVGSVGWQDYALLPGHGPQRPSKLPRRPSLPLTAFVNALGGAGATAYFGVVDVAGARAGETLVVSAAAGSVGSLAGQVGKAIGCRVVGICGSDEKCAWLTGELGFDAAVNYRHDGWCAGLAAACPKGIDVLFENVGGEILDTSMELMNAGGRVALCGLISGYDGDGRIPGNLVPIIMKRLRIQGFLVGDYAARFPEMRRQMSEWIASGKIRTRETVVEGLDNAPEALAMLFTGSNIGKTLVRVADLPT